MVGRPAPIRASCASKEISMPDHSKPRQFCPLDRKSAFRACGNTDLVTALHRWHVAADAAEWTGHRGALLYLMLKAWLVQMERQGDFEGPVPMNVLALRAGRDVSQVRKLMADLMAAGWVSIVADAVSSPTPRYKRAPVWGLGDGGWLQAPTKNIVGKEDIPLSRNPANSSSRNPANFPLDFPLTNGLPSRVVGRGKGLPLTLRSNTRYKELGDCVTWKSTPRKHSFPRLHEDPRIQPGWIKTDPGDFLLWNPGDFLPWDPFRHSDQPFSANTIGKDTYHTQINDIQWSLDPRWQSLGLWASTSPMDRFTASELWLSSKLGPFAFRLAHFSTPWPIHDKRYDRLWSFDEISRATSIDRSNVARFVKRLVTHRYAKMSTGGIKLFFKDHLRNGDDHYERSY